MIAAKDFLLLEASKGRSFYLSDDPVCRHNSQPWDGVYGNMGLACIGIELYLPLSHDLQLCAWCPSIIKAMKSELKEANRLKATATLSVGLHAENTRMQLVEIEKARGRLQSTLDAIEAGAPVVANNDNMDFHNSLQVANANQHVICRSSDFRLAKKFVSENPGQCRPRMVLD